MKHLHCGIRAIPACLVAALAFLAPPAAGARQEQLSDPGFDPAVANPAYRLGSGPRVLFDEAHFNFHTAGGRLNIARWLSGATPVRSPAADTVLLIPEDLHAPDCKELGLVDVRDGHCSLDSFCDCGSYKHRKEGSADQAYAKARRAVSRKGGNALWVLETISLESRKTHHEECCHVTCFRVIALAFSCDPTSLAHEARRVSSNAQSPASQ